MSDDRATLRARFPVPADRDLPPGRHLLHRENLMNQMLNEPPSRGPGRVGGRRPWTRRMLATAAAVVVVAGAGGAAAVKLAPHHARIAGPAGAGTQVATTVPPTVTVQPGSSAEAKVILDRIAVKAAGTPAIAVKPDQWFYIKTKSEYAGASEQRTFDSKWVMYPMTVREDWVGQSPSQQSMFRENGQDTPVSAAQPAGGQGPVTHQLANPSYALLESLPTDPAKLLDFVYQDSHIDGADNNYEAFDEIGQVLATTVVPPKTAAAFYRATALIPGVVEVPDATDAAGRHGLGIALTDNTGERYEWIFSKTTYQYLGERDYQARTTVNAKKGMLIGLSAVLAKGVADSVGGTPTLMP